MDSGHNANDGVKNPWYTVLGKMAPWANFLCSPSSGWVLSRQSSSRWSRLQVSYCRKRREGACVSTWLPHCSSLYPFLPHPWLARTFCSLLTTAPLPSWPQHPGRLHTLPTHKASPDDTCFLITWLYNVSHYYCYHICTVAGEYT